MEMFRLENFCKWVDENLVEGISIKNYVGYYALKKSNTEIFDAYNDGGAPHLRSVYGFKGKTVLTFEEFEKELKERYPELFKKKKKELWTDVESFSKWIEANTSFVVEVDGEDAYAKEKGSYDWVFSYDNKSGMWHHFYRVDSPNTKLFTIEQDERNDSKFIAGKIKEYYPEFMKKTKEQDEIMSKHEVKINGVTYIPETEVRTNQDEIAAKDREIKEANEIIQMLKNDRDNLQDEVDALAGKVDTLQSQVDKIKAIFSDGSCPF